MTNCPKIAVVSKDPLVLRYFSEAKPELDPSPHSRSSRWHICHRSQRLAAVREFPLCQPPRGWKTCGHRVNEPEAPLRVIVERDAKCHPVTRLSDFHQ